MWPTAHNWGAGRIQWSVTARNRRDRIALLGERRRRVDPRGGRVGVSVQVLDVRQVGSGVPEPSRERVAYLIHGEGVPVRPLSRHADQLVRARRRPCPEGVGRDVGTRDRQRLVDQRDSGDARAFLAAPRRTGPARGWCDPLDASSFRWCLMTAPPWHTAMPFGGNARPARGNRADRAAHQFDRRADPVPAGTPRPGRRAGPRARVDHQQQPTMKEQGRNGYRARIPGMRREPDRRTGT